MTRHEMMDELNRLGYNWSLLTKLPDKTLLLIYNYEFKDVLECFTE